MSTAVLCSNKKLTQGLSLLLGFYVLNCLAALSSAVWHESELRDELFSGPALSFTELSTNIPHFVPNFPVQNQTTTLNNFKLIQLSNCSYIARESIPENNNNTGSPESCSFNDTRFLMKVRSNHYLKHVLNSDCDLDSIIHRFSNYSIKNKEFKANNLFLNVEPAYNSDYILQNTTQITSRLNQLALIKFYPEYFNNITEVDIFNNTDVKPFINQFHYSIKNNDYERDYLLFHGRLDNMKMLVSELYKSKLHLILEPDVQSARFFLEVPIVVCSSLHSSQNTTSSFNEREEYILGIFDKYIDRIVHSIIFLVGVVWNGVLILIFIRQEELRTPQNMMIFNLALTDLLSLILNVFLFCFQEYYKPFIETSQIYCRIHITLRPLAIGVSALSVVALSILRYVAIRQSYQIHSTQTTCSLSIRARIYLYISTIWIISFFLSFPYAFLVTFPNGKCKKYGQVHMSKIVTLFEFVLYVVWLPCTMVVFNYLSAKKMKKKPRELTISMRLGGQHFVRHRSAKILKTLMAVFLLTYIPHYVLRMLRLWDEKRYWTFTFKIMYKVSYYLIFANYCFNPISLYMVSRAFRKLYNYYFCCVYDRLVGRFSKKDPRKEDPYTANGISTFVA